ncbi:MAG: farnesyl diphosphate synthase [Candidatus Metalachnospira sp.]|nr:farnesyl diphosphate synthase [Candidatus Metalachnospira sp.]
MSFKDELKEKVNIIDEYLEKYLPSAEEYPQVIFESMRYSVFAGGKRLRPIMVMETCKAFGSEWEKSMPFACSLEMIHTYSLIHDDLPAIDNDDYRRGRLTSHKMFGEDIAILAGDALLHHAFETMSRACVEQNDIKAAKAMLAVAEGAGVHGMVGGQVVDVISEGKPIDKETLDYIHKNKTAAMLIGALKSGAIMGGATDEEVKKIERAGELIGIAFQIQDDILDVTSTFEKLGKPINSDEKNNKVTYATMFGVEKAAEFVENMSDEAISILKGMGDKTDFLVRLTEYLIKREN